MKQNISYGGGRRFIIRQKSHHLFFVTFAQTQNLRII